jgi:hypothetical protein
MDANVRAPHAAPNQEAAAPRTTSRPDPLVVLLAAVGALSCPASVPAADLSVHGFGTIGAAYFVDKPDGWAYTRSLNQRASVADFRADLDSVAGIQANYQATDTVEIVGQASFALLAPAARPGDFLELAFLAWRPNADWRARVGRINLDGYLISDHRDVGFTYQSVRPPVEYYARLPRSLDGVDLTRTWLRGGTQWQLKLLAGNTSNGTGTSRLRTSPLMGLMASRESDGLLVRISALHSRTANDIVALEPLTEGLRQIQLLPVPQVAAQAAGMEQKLRTGGLNSNYVAAAVAYDRHDWLLTAEINRSDAPRNSAIGFTSGYVSVGRRFGPFSGQVTRSAQRRDGHAAQAPDWATPLAPLDAQLAQQAQHLAEGSTQAINSLAGNQSTTSIGMRWDSTPRVAFKVQWDHVKSRRDGSSLWLKAGSSAATADLVAVAVDFVF